MRDFVIIVFECFFCSVENHLRRILYISDVFLLLVFIRVRLGMPAMALLDTDNLSGAPRFYMAARKAGRIVNISSDAARVGSSGEAVYAACKGGLVAFSKTIAREHARHGITVNVVCPGPTDTPLIHAMADELGSGPPITLSGAWLVFVDSSGVGAALARRLASAGARVATVAAGSAFEDQGSGRWLVHAVDATGRQVREQLVAD